MDYLPDILRRLYIYVSDGKEGLDRYDSGKEANRNERGDLDTALSTAVVSQGNKDEIMELVMKRNRVRELLARMEVLQHDGDFKTAELLNDIKGLVGKKVFLCGALKDMQSRGLYELNLSKYTPAKANKMSDGYETESGNKFQVLRRDTVIRSIGGIDRQVQVKKRTYLKVKRENDAIGKKIEMMENLKLSLDNSLDMIDTQTIQKEYVEVIQSSHDILKKRSVNSIDINGIENLVNEQEEIKQKQEEVTEALNDLNPGYRVHEDDIDEQFNLEMEKLGVSFDLLDFINIDSIVQENCTREEEQNYKEVKPVRQKQKMTREMERALYD